MQIGISWTFPVALRLNGADIPLHAILETAAIFIAFRYYLWQRRKTGDHISSGNRLWIVIAATFGAVAGSHLLGAAENVPMWQAAASPWKYLWGNKTLVGGLLGGLWSVELIKRCIGEKQRSGDLFVFPLLLGMVIGRLGCFSMGVFEDTYGTVTDLPWGMDLGDGLQRHPVALYEIGFLFVLGCGLAVIPRRTALQSGARFKLFMIAYLGFRLALDLIKPGWRFAFGLGSIQLACLAGLIYYAPDILNPRALLASSKRSHAS